MATKPLLKPKISDLFNPVTNPAGGFPLAVPKGPDTTDRSKLTVSGQPSLSSIFGGTQVSPAWKNAMSGYQIGEGGQLVKKPTPAPAPTQGPVAPAVSAPAYTAPAALTPAPTAPAPTTPAPTPTQGEVPANWKNADGSMKTADQIAQEIASVLKTTNDNPDVGTLALEQFTDGNKSQTELMTKLRDVNNLRNDIAVGAVDPYKIASESGIAYSPAELQAIERAYAGVYDPALNAVFSKLEQKQAEDAALAEAEAKRNEPYTLGKDQVRYGADGQVIARGPESTDATTPSTSTYNLGTNPTVDAWVEMITSKRASIENAPQELRGLIAQGLSQAPNPKAGYILEQADEGIRSIDTILAKMSGETSGLINTADNPLSRSIFGWVPGSDAKDVNSARDTLAALVGFDTLAKMRESAPSGASGLGQITERELNYLQSVQGSLDTLQSNEQLETTLKKVRDSFEILKIASSPDGTTFELDGVQYIKQGNEMVPADSYVPGNQTSLNRPQRNNNPGNVKTGGLGDKYATGVDEQGHLIFPTPEAGMMAVRDDLQAKISGNSRFVGPNPTIAELGAVYAEDPNWPNKVAAMVGVSPQTRAGDVPFEALVQAVITQEGYYA